MLVISIGVSISAFHAVCDMDLGVNCVSFIFCGPYLKTLNFPPRRQQKKQNPLSAAVM